MPCRAHLFRYTLEAGWPAVSKQLFLNLPPPASGGGALVSQVDLLGAGGANLSAAGCVWAGDYGTPESLNHAAGFHRCDGAARVPSRSITPPWGSIRFRLALRACAPWGCIVRVVSQTKS